MITCCALWCVAILTDVHCYKCWTMKNKCNCEGSVCECVRVLERQDKSEGSITAANLGRRDKAGVGVGMAGGGGSGGGKSSVL